MYNFKKNGKLNQLFKEHFLKTIIAIKRRIDISKLLGITKSLSESNGEFVLHIKNEYDYRMKSDTRD